jgi:hypothetical protein
MSNEIVNKGTLSDKNFKAMNGTMMSENARLLFSAIFDLLDSHFHDVRSLYQPM